MSPVMQIYGYMGWLNTYDTGPLPTLVTATQLQTDGQILFFTQAALLNFLESL